MSKIYKNAIVSKDYRIHIIGNNTLDSAENLTAGSIVCYVFQFPSGEKKFGQLNEHITTDNQIGVNPAELWQKSYSIDARGKNQPNELLGIYVIDRDLWEQVKRQHDIDQLIDNFLRGKVRKSHRHVSKAKQCPFNATISSDQNPTGTNGEVLIGFDQNDEGHWLWLTKIIKESLGLDLDVSDRREFVERLCQYGDVDRAVNMIWKYRKVLLAGYTSYGKTLMAIKAAITYRIKQNLPGGYYFVTSPSSETLKSFGDQAKKFNFGNAKNVIVIGHGSTWTLKKIKEYRDRGYDIFDLNTIQQVRQKKKNVKWTKGLLNKWKPKIDACDVWIRDEKWKEYDGFETRKLMEHIEEECVIFDLAATVQKIRSQYHPDAILDRSLFWALKNRDKTFLPDMRIQSINWPAMTISKELKDLYPSSAEWDPRKLVCPNKARDGFANKSILENLPYYFYKENARAKALGISIVDDSWLCDFSKKVGLWVMPEGEAGWSTKHYLPMLAIMYNNKYSDILYAIDSYEFERRMKQEDVNENEMMEILVDEHKGKHIIMLTHGKFTVGTSIDRLGHIILLDNISSEDLFEQLLGRLLRLCPKDPQDLKTNLKTNIIVKSLCPGMQLKSTVASMVISSCDNTGKEPEAREYFDLLGLQELDPKGNVCTISSQEIMDEIANARLVRNIANLNHNELSKYLSDKSVLMRWKSNLPPGFKFEGANCNWNPRTRLTDGNDSKVKKPKPKPPSTNKELTLDKIVMIISEVFSQVCAESELLDNKDVVECLRKSHDMMPAGLIQFIYTEKILLDILQHRLTQIYKARDMLAEKKAEYKQLMHKGNMFTRAKSMYHTPEGMLFDKLIHLNEYKRDHIWVVFNPTIGGMLRDLLKFGVPKDHIIVVDPYEKFFNDSYIRNDSFDKHFSIENRIAKVDNEEFVCYNKIEDIDMKKFKKSPVLLTNPPYTNGGQDASDEYTKHIRNSILHLNPVAVVAIAPDNLILKSTKEKKSLFKPYSSPVFLKFLEKNRDWKKRININTVLVIWDKNKTSTETVIESRYSNNKFSTVIDESLIFPCETKEEYEYVTRIQTEKKYTSVGPSKETGNTGKEIKLSKDNQWKIIQGKEYTSSNRFMRQSAAYMRTRCVADVPVGVSIRSGYREIHCDRYSPTLDEELHLMNGRYLRCAHTRWLVRLRHVTRTLDSPALSLIPVIDLKSLPKNFSDQDVFDYFDTPNDIRKTILDMGDASPY